MGNLMSISEFAKASAVCRKTLIWYDNIDLFKPAFINSNGYRYYSHDQIYIISMIQMLLELGVSHSQIRDYMKKNSPETARKMLVNQREMINREIAKYEGVLDVINTRLDCLEEAQRNEIGISVRHLPSCPVFISRKLGTVARSEIDDETWIGFYKECDKKGNGFGYPEGFLIHKDAVKDGCCDMVENIVIYVTDNRYANAVMPEGNYAICYCIGGFEDQSAAYKMLRTFLNENELEITGSIWEKRLIDESSAYDKDKQIMRIAVPVDEKLQFRQGGKQNLPQTSVTRKG